MLSIFSDFDATISVYDVGDSLFQEFGDFWHCWKHYAAGKCNIRDLNRMLCASISPKRTLEELNEWALTKDLDAYFPNFLKYCSENNYNFTIISDGYDVYIKPLLERADCHYPYYCNRLVKTEVGFEPIFFGADESCVCSTASCKRNVVLNNSADDDIVVYIGDGHTDYCGAEHSDIVFAKDNLARYCNEHRIPHYTYKSFFDVIRILDKCKKENKLRHRHQAAMKRRNAFINE